MLPFVFVQVALEPAGLFATVCCAGIARSIKRRYNPKALIPGFLVRFLFSGWIQQGWAFRPFFICGCEYMDVARLVEQVVAGLGFELVDFELSPKGRMLRVFIDIERGVTVDDCATVSNQLTRVFEVENVDYDRLEVSSPGLDRPLKKPSDFERFAGQDVQLRLRMPIGNQRNFIGVLKGFADGHVVLQTDKGEIACPIDDIEKARLVPRF